MQTPWEAYSRSFYGAPVALTPGGAKRAGGGEQVSTVFDPKAMLEAGAIGGILGGAGSGVVAARNRGIVRDAARSAANGSRLLRDIENRRAFTAVRDAVSGNLVKSDVLGYNRNRENKEEETNAQITGQLGRNDSGRGHRLYSGASGRDLSGSGFSENDTGRQSQRSDEPGNRRGLDSQYDIITPDTNDLAGWSGRRFGVSEDVIVFAREISQVTGRHIVFDPYIGEGELPSNVIVNGSYDNGIIRVNPNSESPIAQILTHELTHSIEGTVYYRQIQQMILDFYRKDIGGIQKDIQERYGDILKTPDDVNREIVAEFFEKKGIDDMNTLRSVVKVNRSFAEKVVDWLNRIATRITGTKEQKFILEMRDRWREALQETDALLNIEEKYSLNRKNLNSQTEHFLNEWNPDNPGEEFYTVQSQIMEKLSKIWKEKNRAPRMITVRTYHAYYTCLILDAESCTFDIIQAYSLKNIHVEEELSREVNDDPNTRTERDGARVQTDRFSGRRFNRSAGSRIGDERATTADGGLYEESGEFNLRRGDRRGASDHWLSGGYSRKSIYLSDKRIGDLIERYGASNPNYSQAFVTKIDPDAFLRLTTKTPDVVREQTSDINMETLRSNEQTPYIRVDLETGEVVGHEGRHRIAALERAGASDVVIVVVPSRGYNRYDAKPMDELTITGQFSDDEATVMDLIPLNESHRKEIDKTYGERNLLNHHNGVQYSVSRKNDESRADETFDNNEPRKVSKATLSAYGKAAEDGDTATMDATREAVEEGREGITYTPKSNRDLYNEAQEHLKDKIYNEAFDELSQRLDAAKGLELDSLVAEGIQLYVDAVNAGDMSTAIQILEHNSKLGTELGRGVQAFRMLRKMTPAGFVADAKARLNFRYSQKNGFSPAKVNREVQEALSGKEEEILEEAISYFLWFLEKERKKTFMVCFLFFSFFVFVLFCLNFFGFMAKRTNLFVGCLKEKILFGIEIFIGNHFHCKRHCCFG